MGSIVTTHEVISDEAVKKVIGDLGAEHIKAINAFLKMDGVEAAGESFVNDELDWSGYENGEGEYDADSDYSDEIKAAFQNLLKQKEEIERLFKEKTGMTVYLVYNEREDRYDDIDGFAWALTFNSVYHTSPNYKKFVKEYGEKSSWSQVVKFG
jgi:rubrerythrin